MLNGQTFAHGVHPPDSKEDTKHSPIRQFPFASLLIVPLSQHIGKAAIPVVGEGDEVLRGQLIAKPDGFLSVPIHAPATGFVRSIRLSPAVDGTMKPAFFLEPYPASTQEVDDGASCDLRSCTREEILSAIQQAGVVGLGGAGFPTHAKLTIPDDKPIDTVVINGAECEPYLTTDHRVMLEHADDVVRGVASALRATDAERAVIAVEANKPDAADALRRAISAESKLTVKLLPVKYPQGAEKILISSVLGRQIPRGGLPVDVGTVCINVGTAGELGRLLPHGQGLQDRVITVSGPGVLKPGNYRIPIGTPLRFVLQYVGTASDLSTVILGGPMMGIAASSLDIPITKGSTGVLAFTERETGQLTDRREYPCIRCGYCVEACPLFLNPSQLGLLAERGRYQQMTDEYHLMDCFECGCCTFVCPSHIPLVQKFRAAKSLVRRSGGLA
jgi:electron transport complex protein RnfC